MMFYLKKIVAQCLQPMPLSLILLLVGIILLYSSSKQRWGRLLVVISFVLLLIFSNSITSNLSLKPLESQYKPLMVAPKDTKYIVVLGGGIHNFNTSTYPGDQLLSTSSMARLIEGIRLYRQIPNSVLIVSGGHYWKTIDTATAMAKTAEALGVNKQHIYEEKQSVDTAQEAKILAPRLKHQPFILVTSAVHMPRAMALFRKQGLQPIAAPCFYLRQPPISALSFFPSPNAMSVLDYSMHEYLGLAWGKLTNTT